MKLNCQTKGMNSLIKWINALILLLNYQTMIGVAIR
jgi:hypothetical protein